MDQGRGQIPRKYFTPKILVYGFRWKVHKIDELLIKLGEKFTKFDEKLTKFDEKLTKFDEKFTKFDEKFIKLIRGT